MSIIQMSKIVDTSTCIYPSVLPLIYPYTTPHRQFYTFFNTFSTPHRLYFIPLPYLTVRSLPFSTLHCPFPPNHYATPHRPLLIIFNTLMFSVQHLTAFLNLLKHPTPPPVLYPFSTHHCPFLTPLQNIIAHSLPLYSTSPPVPCQYTTPTACMEA